MPLARHTLKIHHHSTLVHTLRKSLQLLMCLTLLIIVHHILHRLEHRHHRDSVALVALAGNALAGCDGDDVWLAILKIYLSKRMNGERWRGQRKVRMKYLESVLLHAFVDLKELYLVCDIGNLKECDSLDGLCG